MPLTRTQVESNLVAMAGGLGGMMAKAGLSVLMDGANPDLNQPIWLALRIMGVPVIDPSNVDDMDLTLVFDSRQPYFMALADVLNDENILAILLLKVDEEHAPDLFFLSQMAKALEKVIARKWKRIQDQYNSGQAIPVMGLMACGPNPPDAMLVPRQIGCCP